jgi:hypothetical protein
LEILRQIALKRPGVNGLPTFLLDRAERNEIAVRFES